ncbi:hypothetical protein ACH6EH_06915 [Paenibacillus sp. JSM ZJ436]
MEFNDFYKEKSAREILQEYGIEDFVLAEWSDDECETKLIEIEKLMK